MDFDTVKAKLGRLVTKLKCRCICTRYRILEFNIGLRCRTFYYRITRAIKNFTEKMSLKFSNARFYCLSHYYWTTGRVKDYIFAITHRQSFNKYIKLKMKARNYYIVRSNDDKDKTKTYLVSLSFHDGFTYDLIIRPATKKDVKPLLRVYFRGAAQGHWGLNLED